MAKSDTPRTDAVWAAQEHNKWDNKVQAFITLASQLEHELAASKHDLERAISNHTADLSAADVARQIAVEFGYRCCEKGINLQATIDAAMKDAK